MNLVHTITRQLKGAPRTRIAPTPSGLLHLGNAMNFLLIATTAKLTDGSVYLRIDDLDSQRARAEFIQDIFDQLTWLGIEWDEGPKDLTQFATYSQSLKPSYYNQRIQDLPSESLFACRCSRSEIETQSRDGLYPGTCRNLKLDLDDISHAVRVRASGSVEFNDLLMGRKVVHLEREVGDFVIRRKGGEPAYQFVSVLEDLERRMDLIIRGEDLLLSTAQQIFIAGLLGSNTDQIRWAHHKLMPGPSGQKLSKSRGSASLQEIRRQGLQPELLYRRFLTWIGGGDSVTTHKTPKSFKELLRTLKIQT